MHNAKPIIVLVDDSAAMRSLFEQVAQEAGVTLQAFESAEASLAFLTTTRPALLVVNVMMPNRDGYSLLRELRTQPLHADTPTVMISSKDYHQDRVAARELGVLEFVPKPISKKALRTLLDTHVPGSSGNAPLA
ncbi:MAG: response regulator [Gammaproteobacteria bacterium]